MGQNKTTYFILNKYYVKKRSYGMFYHGLNIVFIYIVHNIYPCHNDDI